MLSSVYPSIWTQLTFSHLRMRSLDIRNELLDDYYTLGDAYLDLAIGYSGPHNSSM